MAQATIRCNQQHNLVEHDEEKKLVAGLKGGPLRTTRIRTGLTTGLRN